LGVTRSAVLGDVLVDNPSEVVCVINISPPEFFGQLFCCQVVLWLRCGYNGVIFIPVYSFDVGVFLVCRGLRKSGMVCP